MNFFHIICILVILLSTLFIDIFTFFSPLFLQTIFLTCAWCITLSKKNFTTTTLITLLLCIYFFCCYQTCNPIYFILLPTCVFWYLLSRFLYNSWVNPYILFAVYSIIFFQKPLSIDSLEASAKFTIIHFFAILIMSKIYEKYQTIA